MAKIVVLTSVELDQALLAEIAGPGDEVHVVVPAVEQSPLQWLTNEEDAARGVAAEVGRSVEQAVPTGATSSESKPDPPAQLLADAVREHRPDRVVVALRDGDDARWLESGELGRMPGMFEGVPVERIAVR
jgi:hypothetical protein